MYGRRIVLAGMLLAVGSVAWAQQPASAPSQATTAPAATSPEDVQTTIQALKERIKEQDRRINALEGKGDADDKATREEIIAVLKEMNLSSEKKAEDMRVFWKDGLRFETADGNFKMKVGGRLQADYGWIAESDKLAKIVNKPNEDTPDGAEIRRARIALSGEIYKDIEFVTEYDFAGDAVSIKDAYIGMKNVPGVGNVRVGNFKEPFSLEELTSDNYTTFMERGLPNAFVPSYKTGVMIFNGFMKDAAKVDRATYALGAFRNSTDGNVTSDNGYHLTGRLTALPWYENKGDRLLHVGAAYSYQTPNDNRTFAYSSRPEAHFVSKFVNTGNILADDANLFGGELATVVGPWHAESEFIASSVNADKSGSACLTGYYVQTGYFLTGETRPYKTSSGTFDRVRPKKNFRENGGLGAWEVAARFSALDLSDSPVDNALRGELQDVTLGLNWYLNPNVRIMWNYIHAMPNLTATDDAADIVMMRFQVDF